MELTQFNQKLDFLPSVLTSGHLPASSTTGPESDTTPLKKLLGRLPDHKSFLGDGFCAPCPVPNHKDIGHALSIDVENGRITDLRCIDKCSVEQILEALRLTKDDLWPPAPDEECASRQSFLASLEEPADQPDQGRELSFTVEACTAFGEPSEAATSHTENLIARAATLEDISTLTDIGLSRRLVLEAKGSIRFLRDQDEWITWTGTHWEADRSKIGPSRAAKAVAECGTATQP
jgi:hypothetical protein